MTLKSSSQSWSKISHQQTGIRKPKRSVRFIKSSSQKCQSLDLSRFKALPLEIQIKICEACLGSGFRSISPEGYRFFPCHSILTINKQWYNGMRPYVDRRINCWNLDPLLNNTITIGHVKDLGLNFKNLEKIDICLSDKLEELLRLGGNLQELTLYFSELPMMFEGNGTPNITLEFDALKFFAALWAVKSLSLRTLWDGCNGEHPHSVGNKSTSKRGSPAMRRRHTYWYALCQALTCYRKEIQSESAKDTNRLKACFQAAVEVSQQESFLQNPSAAFECKRCGEPHPRPTVADVNRVNSAGDEGEDERECVVM